MAIAIKIILSVIFGYAGVVKIIDPEGMRQAIEAYRVIEGPLAVMAAYFVPALEVVLALALWSKRFHKEAAFIVMALSIFFTGLILSAWLRGLNIECGCFGKALQVHSYAQLIIRDGALVIISAYLWWRLSFAKRA